MKKASNDRLLLWAGLAFALQLGLWVALFIVASRHPVAEVPLAAAPPGR
ncbi:MAG TPA: hypothetical protein VMI53_07805 [Opitutaceae bacterium]|nr:hypothetical protein [Opitutaceae bacterium]